MQLYTSINMNTMIYFARQWPASEDEINHTHALQ